MEKAPKGEIERGKTASLPRRAVPPAAQPQRNVGQMAPSQPEKERTPQREAPYGENLLKTKEVGLPILPDCFPAPGIWPGLKKATARNTVRKWRMGKLSISIPIISGSVFPAPLRGGGIRGLKLPTGGEEAWHRRDNSGEDNFHPEGGYRMGRSPQKFGERYPRQRGSPRFA